MKKTDKQQTQSVDSKANVNPFEAFKTQIKRNIKNMKKDQENNSVNGQGDEMQDSVQNAEEIAAMAKYHWAEEVPSFIYTEDVRKADCYYNVL
jgi:hypothetical protein